MEINRTSSNFYPRSPCGERLSTTTIIICTASFLSTLSLRRATVLCLFWPVYILYFYPRSPCGERHRRKRGRRKSHDFYPRSPCGERQLYINRAAKAVIFLSTLSLRRATTERPKESRSNILFLSTLSLRRATGLGLLGWLRVLISIHALLAESDHSARPGTRQRGAISIHALLAESDLPTDGLFFVNRRFLSTLSLRRATVSYQHVSSDFRDFYPRSPCGERHNTRTYRIYCPAFLSTLSLRRATRNIAYGERQKNNFYPRSPCGERPCSRHVNKPKSEHFYPRSPCGERLVHALILANAVLFLSTLSLRRATLPPTSKTRQN